MKYKVPQTHRKSRRRNTSGVSITELLVASILLGVSLAAVAEVMSMCVLANSKLTRQADTQSAMRVSLERLKRDIRTANKIVSSTPEFPGEISNAQTLIMQLPVYYYDKKNDPGSTDYDSSAAQNALNGLPLPGYDAVMYKVVQDPDPLVQNQFVLQLSRRISETRRNGTILPDPTCSYTPEIFPAQQIAKGIIGPVAPGAAPGSSPVIFTFLARNSTSVGVSTLTSAGSVIPSVVTGTTGVGVDIEIKQNSVNSQTATAFDDVRGAHAEAFLRNPASELGSSDSTYYELN